MMTFPRTLYSHLTISEDLSLMKYNEVRVMFADPVKAAGICMTILSDKYEKVGENLYKFTKFPRPLTMMNRDIMKEVIYAFISGYLTSLRNKEGAYQKAVKAAKKVYSDPIFSNVLEEIAEELLLNTYDPHVRLLLTIA